MLLIANSELQMLGEILLKLVSCRPVFSCSVTDLRGGWMLMKMPIDMSVCWLCNISECLLCALCFLDPCIFNFLSIGIVFSDSTSEEPARHRPKTIRTSGGHYCISGASVFLSEHNNDSVVLWSWQGNSLTLTLH